MLQAALAVLVVAAIAFYGWSSRAFLVDIVGFAASERGGIADAYRLDTEDDEEELAAGRAGSSASAIESTTTALGVDLYVADAGDTREVVLTAEQRSVEQIDAEMTGGSAILGGTVVDTRGAPIPGATVRVDRFVDAYSTSVDVRANGAGAWRISNLQGGRYRVRAFAPPDLSQIESTTIFLSAETEQSLQLMVTRGGGVKIDPWVSRDGFVIGQAASIGIRLRQEIVNQQGQVILIGRPDVPVRLAVTGTLRGGGTKPSNADGTVAWTVRCVAEGLAGATLFVDNTPYNVSVPTCRKAPPVTTAPPTTRPPTTRPPTTRPVTTRPPSTNQPSTTQATTPPSTTSTASTVPPSTASTAPSSTAAPTTTTTAAPTITTAAPTTTTTAAPTTTTAAPTITTAPTTTASGG